MSPRRSLHNRTALTPAAAELRHLRESLRLSHEEVAGIIGYDAKTVKRWESGEYEPRAGAIEAMRARWGRAVNATRVPSSELRFIDLFAGIGGMRRGFEAIGGRCVFTSEWDELCQKTYRANFQDALIHGDIRDVEPNQIPEHDVLLAGFPCQPFSIAGVSKKNSLGRPHGFKCVTQGTLFFSIETILKHHRPQAFLLENVKHLQNHDRGNTFRTIMDVLTGLGYHVATKVVDARCFVPQHRERVFFVGFREDVGFDWSMVGLPPEPNWPVLRSALHSEDGQEEPELPYTDERGKVNRKYILSNQLWRYLQDYAAKHKAQGNGFGFGLVGRDDVARTLSARYFKDGSEILVRRGRGNPRRLTPRECARLMGFDQPNSKRFEIPVSDTRAYSQFGNAVVVPVVEAIARAMKPFLYGARVQREQLSFDFAQAI